MLARTRILKIWLGFLLFIQAGCLLCANICVAEMHFSGRKDTRSYNPNTADKIDIPIGGIGSGSIRFDENASFAIWSIFNNKNQAHIPHTFFAIRTQDEEGTINVKSLDRSAAGPFEGIERMELESQFPYVWFSYQPDDMPVKIELQAYNPFIPCNLKDSSIPCAIFCIEVENISNRAMSIGLLASCQNAVGYDGAGDISQGRVHSGYGYNQNEVIQMEKAKAVHMTGTLPKHWENYGSMTICSLAPNATATASWENIDSLYEDFYADGNLSGQSKTVSKGLWSKTDPKTVDCALAQRGKIQPGESHIFRYIFSWHFPNGANGFLLSSTWRGEGNMYANRYEDSLHVCRDVIKRLDQLQGDTKLFYDTYYSSNVPVWVLDRIASQLFSLRSPACFWDKQGNFGLWEGTFVNCGSCAGNCTHVLQYAQAHAELFPEIDVRMRSQDFQIMNEDGGIPFRHIIQENKYGVAFDGQCGSLLAAYRTHLKNPDNRWLEEYWPKIRKGIHYLISKFDPNEQGYVSGWAWNTYDCSTWADCSWLNSLYLAAMDAGRKMAKIMQDQESYTRYEAVFRKGKAHFQNLFNGEYFVQNTDDPMPGIKEHGLLYGNGSHADQLLGCWWGYQLGLSDIVEVNQARQALKNIYKNNFLKSFKGFRQHPRRFCDDSDAGMVVVSWPQNNRPEHFLKYSDEVWTGLEYACASAMLYNDLTEEAFTILKAVYDRYDGKSGQDWAYGYWSHNPFGDVECGGFYSRALSSWSVLTALQGRVYNGPARSISFHPHYRPDDHKSFFVASQGWGTFRRLIRGKIQDNEIHLHYGTLYLKTLEFDTGSNRQIENVHVFYNGSQVQQKETSDNQKITVSLKSPILLHKNEILKVQVEYEK